MVMVFHKHSEINKRANLPKKGKLTHMLFQTQDIHSSSEHSWRKFKYSLIIFVHPF